MKRLNHTKEARIDAATDRTTADDPECPTECMWCVHKHQELLCRRRLYISQNCENVNLNKEGNNFFKDRKRIYTDGLMRKSHEYCNAKHPGIFKVKGCPLCCACDGCQNRIGRMKGLISMMIIFSLGVVMTVVSAGGMNQKICMWQTTTVICL